MRPVALGALRNPCAREGARSRGALARSRGVATALLAREFLTAMESYKLNGALARTDFVCKACIELVGFLALSAGLALRERRSLRKSTPLSPTYAKTAHSASPTLFSER